MWRVDEFPAVTCPVHHPDRPLASGPGRASVTGMPFDELLAERVRALLDDDGVEDVAEQRMFGGLAFLVGGNMAVAVSGAAWAAG